MKEISDAILRKRAEQITIGDYTFVLLTYGLATEKPETPLPVT
jgi:hypothetical protein